MAIRIFTISIQDDGRETEALNAFLGAHKVLTVEKRWVDQGSGSFWCFCVDYHEGSQPGEAPRLGLGRNRVDYREKLPPEQFALFAKLREERKIISTAEAVPVHTIFTNEQLAQMVQTQAKTKADLEKIAGVGDSRIEKYGARMLAILEQERNGNHEAHGKPG